MTGRDPVLVVLKDFLPLETASDLSARIEATDWDGFFESMFVIGDVPAFDLRDPTFYLEATVLLLADVAYIGLLLTSVSHWFETIKSSPSP